LGVERLYIKQNNALPEILFCPVENLKNCIVAPSLMNSLLLLRSCAFYESRDFEQFAGCLQQRIEIKYHPNCLSENSAETPLP